MWLRTSLLIGVAVEGVLVLERYLSRSVYVQGWLVKSLAAFVRGTGAERWVGEWFVARIASRESWIISRELSALLRDSAILAREYPMLLRESCDAMLECNLAFCNEAYKVSWWTLVFREDIIVWVSGWQAKRIPLGS